MLQDQLKKVPPLLFGWQLYLMEGRLGTIFLTRSKSIGKKYLLLFSEDTCYNDPMEPEAKHMAQPQLILGSWKELSTWADEFKDCNDLLLIVPGNAAPKNSPPKEAMTLAEALQGRTGLVSFEPKDLSEETGKKFSDLLVEKHRKEQR